MPFVRVVTYTTRNFALIVTFFSVIAIRQSAEKQSIIIDRHVAMLLAMTIEWYAISSNTLYVAIEFRLYLSAVSGSDV